MSTKKVTFTLAREGFHLHNLSANKSKPTLAFCRFGLDSFQKFAVERLGSSDFALSDVTANLIREYLSALREKKDTYHHHNDKPLSPFTIAGYYRGLRAFFNWCQAEELIEKNPIERVESPKTPKPIKPRFTEEEIKRLLRACDQYAPSLAVRNRAILMLLLDTGIRAGELCSLTLDRLAENFQRAHIIGKGSKDRYVPIGSKTRSLLWKYVSVFRPNSVYLEVFLTNRGSPLDVRELDRLLKYIGQRAQVQGVYAHRFRHSAARLFLRNGGNQFALKELLGHSSIVTTSVYVQLEQSDLEQQHERFSPVDRLGV